MTMRYESYSFRFADPVINSKLVLKNEILEVIKEVQPGSPRQGSKRKFDYDQKQLNDDFVKGFVKRKWNRQPKSVKGLNLKADFNKERVQIEVQFGNVARYYADLLKFQIAFLQGDIDVGVEIVAIQSFAKKMGENLANYERCVREVEHFKTIITMPTWIIGVEPDNKTGKARVNKSDEDFEKPSSIEEYEEDI